MPYYVYIIRCDDNSLYTGYTKNLDSRMKMHENGKGARYTKMHKPKQLVHFEKFSSRAEAMRREKNIKRMSHPRKIELTKHSSKIRLKHQKKKKTT